MALYEIMKTEFALVPGRPGHYVQKTSVITSTMDKDMAEKMLEIYRHNQSDDESYEIRTLRISEGHKW